MKPVFPAQTGTGTEPLSCGIDPGRYKIQVALLSPSRVHCNQSFPISASTVKALHKLLPPQTPLIAEGFGTAGRLFFLELTRARIPCFELNPQLGKHLRILENEGRTDARDAESCAKAAFFFSRLSPLEFREEQETLFLLVRRYLRLRDERVAHLNTLHALLSESYGSLYRSLGTKVNPRTTQGRAFFARYPSINALLGSRLKRKALEAFFPPEKAADLLRESAPWEARTYLSALEEDIRALLESVERESAALSSLRQQMEKLVLSHPQGHYLLSIPGCGCVSAAILLCVIRDIKRFPSESHFAGYCGLGKVTNQSGEGKSVQKRKMYHRLLQGAFHDLAFASLRSSPLAKTYYQKKRRQGRTHRQALMALARYYCRIVYSLLRQERPYVAERAAG